MVRHRETSSVAVARCAFPENKVENKNCRMRAIWPELRPLARVYVAESKQKGGRRGILKTDVQIALRRTSHQAFTSLTTSNELQPSRAADSLRRKSDSSNGGPCLSSAPIHCIGISAITR
jgi:hypothetical protein